MKRCNIIVALMVCLVVTLAGCEGRNNLLEEFTITLMINPTGGGTLQGGGKYKKGVEATIIATANEGYVFENWTEGGVEVSTEASYKFTVTKNRNLVANFIDTPYTPPPGYNARDYVKLVTFLQGSHDGIKNGERLNSDYDPNDPDTWSGVTWTEGEPLRVQEINWASNLNIYGSLDLSGCLALEKFWCTGNELNSLDLSGCLALEELYCNNNELISLDVSSCNFLNVLRCSGNRLSFSSLPLSSGINTYEYSPQKPVPIGTHGKIAAGGSVNLSQEAARDGADTGFTWYEKEGGIVLPDNPEPGVFIFGQSLAGKTLYCEMTNIKFPELTLETFEVLVLEE